MRAKNVIFGAIYRNQEEEKNKKCPDESKKSDFRGKIQEQKE